MRMVPPLDIASGGDERHLRRTVRTPSQPEALGLGPVTCCHMTVLYHVWMRRCALNALVGDCGHVIVHAG